MARSLLSLVLICMCFPIFGQEAKYQFSQELFASDKYSRTRYERFPGEIVMLDGDTYKFGEKTIKISLENKRYEVIFRKGILNPDVVFGKEMTRKDQEELKQLTKNERIFYNMIRNDRLSICCIQELKKPSYLRNIEESRERNKRFFRRAY